MTRLLLWEEYRAANPDGFGYTWFCTTFEAWKQRARTSMRQTHVGGEKVFVDFAGEPNCRSIAGPPIDTAIGMLIAEQMTPAAVELTLDIRREIEARCEEADRVRCRSIERAKIEADLAQRRFMLVNPNNRLVADTLEGEWNDKLRVLAKAREDRERAREQDQLVLDEAVRERLIAMTVDSSKLWADPDTPDRERKRLLAHIIEDVTLIKMPAERTTKIHVRCTHTTKTA